MTNLAASLRDRIWILRAEQTPNSDGGFTQTYVLLVGVWAAILPLGNDVFNRIRYLGSVQVEDNMTHQITIRRIGVEHIGAEYDPDAFDDAFRTGGNLLPMKGDYYVFVPYGDVLDGAYGDAYSEDEFRSLAASRGRLMKIEQAFDPNERFEQIKLLCSAIEEWDGNYA